MKRGVSFDSSSPIFVRYYMKHIKVRFDNVRPMSVNAQYNFNSKRKTQFKSKQYDVFTILINQRLNYFKKEMRAFEQAFCSESQVINARYIFYFPESLIINKNGKIKKRRYDIDNLFKSLNDVIFKRMPSLDDSFIFNLYGVKAVSPDDEFHIECQLYAESKEKHLQQFN